jgi:hypothetical protein
MYKNKNKEFRCSVCGCTNYETSQFYYHSPIGDNLCTRHYQQLKRHGKIIKKIDKNEIVLHDDYAEMILYNKQEEELARTLISLDKVDLIKNYRWNYSSSNGYVSSGAGKDQILLHRFIMNAPKDKVVDHIDGNKLDNMNNNLRICSHCENSQNSIMKSNNTSGITGVWLDKRYKGNTWVAEIYANGQKYYLGRYKNKDDAIKVRKEAEDKYFGDFCVSKWRRI